MTFSYTMCNVESLLPHQWQHDIMRVATSYASRRTLVASSVTSRESSTDARVDALTVGGIVVARELPWLHWLYRTKFRCLGEEYTGQRLFCAEKDIRYALNINVQMGSSMRYECHVDSNPVECLLYVTTHPPGSGGELVVARNPHSRGPQQIAADSVKIHPCAGHLVFFDARKYPHYVNSLENHDDIRVVVAMNYYNDACTEAMRPPDLNRHLFGED